MHSVHVRVIIISLRLDGTKHLWRSSSDIRKPGRFCNLSLRTRWNHGQHAQIRPELQQASLWRLTRRDLRASNTDLRSWTYRLNKQQQPRVIHTGLYLLGTYPYMMLYTMTKPRLFMYNLLNMSTIVTSSILSNKLISIVNWSICYLYFIVAKYSLGSTTSFYLSVSVTYI